MGSKTWKDPFMPTPLKKLGYQCSNNKKKSSSHYPGADHYI